MTSLEMPLVFPVTCHTDTVGKGTTFVVIKGLSKDGLEFVPLALEKGAIKIVVEKNVSISSQLHDLCASYGAIIDYVDNSRQALAELSAQAAGYPAQKLKIYAVTGTKGKTSSVWMLYHMFCNLRIKAALISTIGNYLNTYHFKSGMTTPQPDYIHQFLKLCVEQGITHVVMETAAQATTFFRLETIQFDALIFTNLEREHKELYSSMEDYFEAKRKLCDHLKPGGDLFVNYDTPFGKKMCQIYPHAVSFSCETEKSTWSCSWNDTEPEKIVTLSFNPPTKNHARISYIFTYSQFIGLFNGYNLLGVLLVIIYNDCVYKEIQDALDMIPSIPGRMEKYTLKNGATVIIDYAHTPSSFEALFTALSQPSLKLFIVFGAGGGKDPDKRPLMGSIAALYGTRVFITNDNPRYEDPHIIASDIYQGIPSDYHHKVTIELDRQKAIEAAIQESDKDTLILLLGKGPDEYQLIQGAKIVFSERLIALQYQ